MSKIVHLGSQGKVVEETQHLLHHNRFGRKFLGRRSPVDGKFGSATLVAVRRAKFILGYPDKEINGRAGERFRSYLADTKLPRRWAIRGLYRRRREALMRRHTRALRIAQSQIGYVEGTNNHTKFGEWYGMDHVAWCAEFQSWCEEQAGLLFHYAYCPFVWADAKARKNGLRVVGKPSPGDHVLYDWDGDGLADHIGMVEKRGVYIEGNTSTADWSNGGMVMRRTDRSTSQIQGFVRATKARAK